MTACRLIVDAAASGPWNMAVDEVLLATAAARGLATLRFYAWSEPTLSLGYFQTAAQRTAHPPSRECPLVRRQTGGGAILHDDELTYSLALPYAHPLAAETARLYDAVHRALVAALGELAIAARLRPQPPAARLAAEPFLCFQRQTAGDVLVGSTKVCGSAQRRRRCAILQHGSLLLGRSAHAPELAGIADLEARRPQVGPLVSCWQTAIARRLELALEAAPLEAAEQVAARALALEKYSSPRWTHKR